MAVTQKLARISFERAQAASSSQDALDSIISFDALANDAFEDFNWSPALLGRALTVLRRVGLASLVSQAFEGECILNPSSPRGPNEYAVYSEITVNSHGTVVRLARELGKLPVVEMSLTRDEVAAQHPGYALPDDYPEFVSSYARNLATFYADAAHHNQVVVCWWD